MPKLLIVHKEEEGKYICFDTAYAMSEVAKAAPQSPPPYYELFVEEIPLPQIGEIWYDVIDPLIPLKVTSLEAIYIGVNIDLVISFREIITKENKNWCEGRVIQIKFTDKRFKPWKTKK
jgi:hypothetical protein